MKAALEEAKQRLERHAETDQDRALLVSADLSRLPEQLRECEEAGAHYILFDVMAAVRPAITIGWPIVDAIRRNNTNQSRRPSDGHRAGSGRGSWRGGGHHKVHVDSDAPCNRTCRRCTHRKKAASASTPDDGHQRSTRFCRRSSSEVMAVNRAHPASASSRPCSRRSSTCAV